MSTATATTATATAAANKSGPRDPQGKLATLFGVVLVVLGVVDASGILSDDDRLLGVFRIPPSLNVVHVLTGLLGLFLARYVGGATLFNKLGGVIYGVVTVGGVISVLAGRDGVSWETNAVHLLLAVIVGWVGFEGGKRRPT